MIGIRSVLMLGALAALAAGCVKPATQASPTTPAELLARGAYLAEQGDDFGAEQYFIAARSAGYPEPEVVRRLLQVCVKAGRLEQALKHAETYLERNPDDWRLRHLVASIQFAKGDAETARFELGVVLADHPEHAESEYLLGMVLRDGLSDLDGAARAFRSYLALSPHGEHARETEAWLRRRAAFPVATPVPTALVSAP